MEGALKYIFFKIIAWPVGIILFLASKLLFLTSSVRINGIIFEGPAIYGSWHQHLPFLLIHVKKEDSSELLLKLVENRLNELG